MSLHPRLQPDLCLGVDLPGRAQQALLLGGDAGESARVLGRGECLGQCHRIRGVRRRPRPEGSIHPAQVLAGVADPQHRIEEGLDAAVASGEQPQRTRGRHREQRRVAPRAARAAPCGVGAALRGQGLARLSGSVCDEARDSLGGVDRRGIVVLDSAQEQHVREAHDPEADLARRAARLADLSVGKARRLDHVVEQPYAVAHGLAQSLGVDAPARVREGGQTQCGEHAALVGQQRLLAAWIRCVQGPALGVWVRALDRIDEEHARLAGIVDRFGDRLEQGRGPLAGIERGIVEGHCDAQARQGSGAAALRAHEGEHVRMTVVEDRQVRPGTAPRPAVHLGRAGEEIQEGDRSRGDAPGAGDRAASWPQPRQVDAASSHALLDPRGTRERVVDRAQGVVGLEHVAGGERPASPRVGEGRQAREELQGAHALGEARTPVLALAPGLRARQGPSHPARHVCEGRFARGRAQRPEYGVARLRRLAHASKPTRSAPRPVRDSPRRSRRAEPGAGANPRCRAAPRARPGTPCRSAGRSRPPRASSR